MTRDEEIKSEGWIEQDNRIIHFLCAEDALATAMEQRLAPTDAGRLRLKETFAYLADRARGECPLCGYDDQRCQCWRDDS